MKASDKLLETANPRTTTLHRQQLARTLEKKTPNHCNIKTETQEKKILYS
jgi:hypothetical protein